MLIVRPARHEDLAGIEQLVVSQGVRVSTLPQSRDKLSEKIDQSLRSLRRGAGNGRAPALSVRPGGQQ